MRVAVLTTPTKHHTYFLNRLAERFDLVGIFYERRHLVKPYPTGPFFDDDEEAYEERFFDPASGGTGRQLDEELARRVVSVHSVNQQGVAAHLAALDPDIGITFGTGLVKPDVFTVPRWGTVNVHRGIAQRFRGLDSDLWAFHERAFDAVGVTIHMVDEDLDTGAIVGQATVPVEPDDEIFHFRYKTTVVATQLVLDALELAEKHDGPPPSRPQRETGRYYSAMSLDEKHVALARFLEHREGLRRGQR